MIIITGGAGFIGSAVVGELNRRGEKNLLIVDNLGRGEKWKNLRNKTYLDFVHKNDFLSHLYKNHFPKVEGIIHMGACSSTTEDDCDYLMDNNYHYTRLIAEWCANNKVRLVYASSAATYGAGEHGFDDAPALIPLLTPLNMYGYSKQLLDEWALANNLPCVGVKFFNVYGPNEYHKGNMTSVIYKAYHQIKETGKMQLFKSYLPAYPHGGQLRDFLYVKDAVNTVLWLYAQPQISGIFNIGTGKARTWNDLAHAVFAALETPVNIEYVDIPPALKGKYQYFTEATTTRLYGTGCPQLAYGLEEGVSDYLKNYLCQENPYL